MSRALHRSVFLVGWCTSVLALLVCIAHALSPMWYRFMLMNIVGDSYTHMPMTYVIPEYLFYALNLPVAIVVSFGFGDFSAVGVSPKTRLIMVFAADLLLTTCWWSAVSRCVRAIQRFARNVSR